MKVKYFIKIEHDIDVYDNVIGGLGIAFCGPLEMTKEGEKYFEEVLNYEIQINGSPRYSVAIIDIDYDDWKRQRKKAEEFLYAAAGYCYEDDYERWFKEV